MPPAKIDFGKHVLIALDLTIWIDINHRAIHLKQRNHFRNVVLHHQRVRLARRLINIRPFRSRPIVFQVMPAALEHKAVYRLRMDEENRRIEVKAIQSQREMANCGTRI
jgi:hypothetical protein